jgi:hypothetical protein
MKFESGSEIDSAHCTALTHEYFRCHDYFTHFAELGERMILSGRTKELSYRTYNAYAGFVHHLYEFLMGCYARELGDTEIISSKGKRHEKEKILDSMVYSSVQRVMNKRKTAIEKGYAPEWENHISCYTQPVPREFPEEFRKCRNKISGHVSYKRASELSLTNFYREYHKYLYLLYQDSTYFWGKKEGEFPDLKEITEFSLMLEEKNA